jgi:hypothetical protein
LFNANGFVPASLVEYMKSLSRRFSQSTEEFRDGRSALRHLRQLVYGFR